MRRASGEAVLLGLLHGPAELVPVSSSAHVAALPWLLGWEVAGWDGARRKELEVALHTGTALGLLAVLHPWRARRPRAAVLAAAVVPPGLAGLILERRIETRLGTPATLPPGLLAGAAALLLADRAPGRRAAEEATLFDGLWLGLAQSAALVPGVSRNGATLAAARARGFGRPDASRLSWDVALPVLLGATGLKAWRRRRTARGTVPLYVGAGAAFASTVVGARAIGIERRAPLWPWAAWRAGLALAVLGVRQNRAR